MTSSLASGYQAGAGFVARDEGRLREHDAPRRREKWENHKCR